MVSKCWYFVNNQYVSYIDFYSELLLTCDYPNQLFDAMADLIKYNRTNLKGKEFKIKLFY